jgi:hypothetical protein
MIDLIDYLAAGNSNGDIPMLQFAAARPARGWGC